MKKINILIYSVSAMIAIVIIGLGSCSPKTTADVSNKVEVYKDKLPFTMKNGELVRPADYRSWVYVGTPVTPHDLNGGRASFPEMHNVYIDHGSYEHYKETGDFREGTIIVKELVSVGATSASSGKGYFEGEFLGLEASVKSKQYFPNEPDYWAIFSFTNPETGILKATAPALPAANCVACHQANAAHDNVFTQYYPVLRAARGVGKGIIPENSARRMKEKMSDNGAPKPGIWDPTGPSPESLAGISLKEEDLFKWLQSGEYKKWKNQESKVHTSAGPHEDVKVFINDKLAASLAAKNSTHPVGVMAVKEQYKSNGEDFGWSIMGKTNDDTDGGKGWFWYEVTSMKDITKKATLGNGVVGCTSCHTAGNDMVRIGFPLK